MVVAIRTHSRRALDNLALDLVEGVRKDGLHRHARLPHGLEIVMQRSPAGCRRRRWRLALAREQEYPSQEEVEDCCLAFKVPESATERRLRRCRTHPKSGRHIHYHVVELTWEEEEPSA